MPVAVRRTPPVISPIRWRRVGHAFGHVLRETAAKLAFLAYFTVVAAALAAPAARADVSLNGQPLDLRVHRGATCLDLELLSDELAVWAKQLDVPRGVVIDVVGSDDDPHTLTTRVRAPDGSVAERVFSPAPTFCPYLHQAVALTLSLALKALAGSGASLSPLAPDLDTPAAPTPAAVSVPTRSTRITFAPAVGPSLLAGLVGKLAYGAEASLAAQLRHASVGAAFGLWRAPREGLPPSAASFDARALAVRVGGCARARAARAKLWLEGCIEGVTLLAHIAEHGARTAREVDRTLWGLAPGIAVSRDLGSRWFLRLGVQLVSVARPLRIAVRDEQGQLIAGQDLSRVGGLFSVALGYRVEKSLGAH